jgi:hypothetical protein
LAKTEALHDLRKRNAAQLAIDASEYYAARVTYVERLYASSAAPRMNGQPLHPAAVNRRANRSKCSNSKQSRHYV